MKTVWKRIDGEGERGEHRTRKAEKLVRLRMAGRRRRREVDSEQAHPTVPLRSERTTCPV